MGFLSRQSDPDEDGEPLGNRSIRSFIATDGVVRGGERPEFIDTSRPGSEPAGGMLTNWSRKQKSGPAAEPKSVEAIQEGYEDLFQ
jgi:hypothetical protein